MSGTNEQLPGERGVSPVARPPRITPRQRAIGIGIVGAAVAGYFIFRSPSEPDHDKDYRPPAIIAQDQAFEPAKVVQVVAKPPTPEQKNKELVDQLMNGKTGDPLADARKAKPMGEDYKPASAPAVAQVAAGGAETPQQQSELASRLHTSVVEVSMAQVIPHPEVTLTAGEMIPCTLLSAIDSSAPGMVTCRTQADAYGSTGTVIVLPRGSKVIGEYGTDMRQGQGRLFVVWNRAETPDHVKITLASPGSDQLGRGGFDGQIDTHFWARFGTALLLTAIDGAFSVVSNLASKSGSTSINFGGSSTAADTALRDGLQIQPTIHKNQGETVGIMVRADLDFSAVYTLGMRAGR
jgi:type IV secretion system protein VirB10